MSAGLHPVLSVPHRTKTKRSLFVLVVLGLSLYFLLPQLWRIEHAFRVASSLKIPFVAVSLAAQVLSYLGSGYLLRAVVGQVTRPISVLEGALLTVGANSVGTLGGGVLGTAGITYLWLRQRGVSPGAAGLAGWIPIFLNDSALAVVSLIGLLTLMLLKKFSNILALNLAVAVLITAAGIGAFVWCLTHRERLTSLAIEIAKFAARFRRKAPDRHATEVALERLFDAWDTLVEGGWGKPATGAALNLGFDVVTLAFLFLSAGHSICLLVLVAGYGVPQLLGKLTVILGGIGVVETTMVGLYGALGVPISIAVVVVLVYRLFSFWLPTIVGIALMPYFDRWIAASNQDRQAAGAALK
jgi:glycosyltransferase 2 family protein